MIQLLKLSVLCLLFALVAPSAAHAQRPYGVAGNEPRLIGAGQPTWNGGGPIPATGTTPLYRDSTRNRAACFGFDTLIGVGSDVLTSYCMSMTATVTLSAPGTTAQGMLTDGYDGSQGQCSGQTVAPNDTAWLIPRWDILSSAVGARTGICSVGLALRTGEQTYYPFCRVDGDCTDAAGSGTCIASGACSGAICATTSFMSARGCVFVIPRAASATNNGRGVLLR